MLSTAANYQTTAPGGSPAPLAPSLDSLQDNLYQTAETLRAILHRLRGPAPEQASPPGSTETKDVSVAERVMNCHGHAGRITNMVAEINGLI